MKECQTNSGGCEAGGVVGLVRIPWRAEDPGGCADGVVVRALGVWELNIPVRLLFVAYDDEHEDYGVVDALHTAVGARVVGACGNLIDAGFARESFVQYRSPFVGEYDY